MTGFVLTGTNCVLNLTNAATPKYSCAGGNTLAGTICYRPAVTSANQHARNGSYNCTGLGGYTLSGSSCIGGTIVSPFSSMHPRSGAISYSCPANYTLSAGQCMAVTTNASLSHTCQTGYTLSGTNCVLTITGPATISGYTCPAGFTLINSSCSKVNKVALSYSCPSGTLVNSRNCQVQSTVYRQPDSTNASDRTLAYIYGPEHQRVRESVTLSGSGTSSYFAGNTWYLNGEDSLGLTYEKEVRANGTTEHKHYLTVAGQVFAQYISRTGTPNGLPSNSVSYFQHDHLGSITAITDQDGVVTERLAYDPWGKRRNIMNSPGTLDARDLLVGRHTDRGYTEHQHLDEIGVIHMNGRVYDPHIGRFMSADPIVQAPYNLQAFNRYSYVLNNPLFYTDPTGYNAYHDSYSGAGYGSTNTDNSSDTSGVGGVSNGHGGQVGGNSGNSAVSMVNTYSPPKPVVGPPTQVAQAQVAVTGIVITAAMVAAATEQQKAAMAKALVDAYNSLKNGIKDGVRTLNEALRVNPGAKKPEDGAADSEGRTRGLPPEGVTPPAGDVKEGPASRPSEQDKGGKSLWDSSGGEWRYSPEDKWHNPHWDYNPHDKPSSPWQNVPIDQLPPRK